MRLEVPPDKDTITLLESPTAFESITVFESNTHVLPSESTYSSVRQPHSNLEWRSDWFVGRHRDALLLTTTVVSSDWTLVRVMQRPLLFAVNLQVSSAYPWISILLRIPVSLCNLSTACHVKSTKYIRSIREKIIKPMGNTNGKNIVLWLNELNY